MLTTMTEEPAHTRRHMFKSKWGKILKADDQAKAGKRIAQDDDVSDFLKGASRSNSVASSVTRPIVSPRIDIAAAQRWPDAAQLQHLASGEYKVPSPLPVDVSGRARKRKNLTVRFVNTPPEVIGHGGDETETPPMEIAHLRIALNRSKSARRPEQPQDIVAAPYGGGSPVRPGMADRAQTHQGNSEAFTRLASAGVFADRPPSRDNRVEDDEPRPGMLRRTQTGFSSTGDSPSVSDDDAPPMPSLPPLAPHRAVPTPRIEAPIMFPRDPQDKLPSDRTPKILHKASSDSIYDTQRKMRVEEAQAFSRAYRLSQTFPAGQDGSRPSSRSSDQSYSRPSVDTGGPSFGTVHPEMNTGAQHERVPVRNRPSPSPNRFSGDRFLQPGAMQSHERLTPPITPPTGQAKSAGLAPQDYIEFFKAKTRSRSNSATNRPPSRDTQATNHDSPLQASLPEEPLRVSEKVSEPPAPPHSASDQLYHAQDPQIMTRVRDAGPTQTRVPARRAVPAHTSPSEGSPRTAQRNASDTSDSPHKYTNTKLADQSPQSAMQGPSRRADPLAVAAFEDFGSRVNQMKGVFRLTAQKERGDPSIPTRQWIRCAYWWMHRGRLELETQVRLHQQRGLLTQAHVDVAKAWWVLVENFDEGDSPTDPHDAEEIASLRYYLQTLALWMEKQHILPPTASLIQGQDTRVWLPYPPFSPDLEYLLGCTNPSNRAADVLPLSDTRDYFFYQRMFVIASVSTDDPRSDRMRLPCTLSLMRHRLHYRASVVLASQNELVNVLVGPELGPEKKGPTWHDLTWNAKSCTMTVNLPRGLALKVAMEETDYRSLSAMIEYTRSMDKSFHPGVDESLIYSSPLHEAHYSDKTKGHTFPEGKIRRAYIGVFETVKHQSHENFVQKSHQGFRIMLITPSTSRTLGVVSRSFDARSPALFEVPDAPSEQANQAVILQSPDPNHPWRSLLVFDSRPAFNDFLDLLHGTFKSPLEMTKVSLAVRSFTAETFLDSSSSNASLAVLSRLQWQNADIISGPASTPGASSSSPILNPSLRLILSHSAGTITDRLNLLPGEFQFRLPVDPSPASSILLARLPHNDITQCIDRRAAMPGSLEKLVSVTPSLSSVPTLRTLTFASRADLHAFQQEMTGFRVVADLHPSLFSINRRRMVVSIVKKLEATRVRLQVLKREGGDTRIAVWFENFSHADAMCFAVKGSDEFERVKGEKGAKGGGVRLVEAKFSLPKKAGGEAYNDDDDDDDEDHRHGNGGGGTLDTGAGRDLSRSIKRRFVNVEGLEYMEEHDDITVGFETETDVESFCDALPSTVSSARGFLSKRRN
ncbi:Protein kinase byr2 [Sphaceloma murrayae]|uniref:Protein kinase byr2 n=1 Tax=Sphaceloma murrayae TaxID=2082308 RepID=A0A2K1R0L4_9PEZI|nr:Protein kinase byr2 [Sphaceloma murrayae]